MKRKILAGNLLFHMLLVLALIPASATQADGGLSASIEALRDEAIAINRDLYLLERAITYPPETRLEVFVAVNSGVYLALSSVKLKINGETVALHPYQPQEVSALEQGGMHRIYTGNLNPGEHEVTVFVEGQGPHQRAYKKAATLMLEKALEPVQLAVVVADQASHFQPAIEIRQW